MLQRSAGMRRAMPVSGVQLTPEPERQALMTSTTLILAAFVGVLSMIAPGMSHAQQPASTAASDASPHPTFDLNTADAHQLEQLPGVGPRRAQAILELRTKLRGFTRIEQLLQVKGIGRATFRKLRPWLTLEPASTKP